VAYFPTAFFDLSWRYALRIRQATGLPLAQALLNYTHLYLAFGLERTFDPEAAPWVEFLDGLALAADPVGWIEQNYLQLTGGLPPAPPQDAFGLFSYALWEGVRVRLHFRSDPNGPSPLGWTQMAERLDELAALFAHLRAHVAEARSVVGGSWLYNIEAYRRLFPPGYLATAQPEETEAQFIALWGQFLDHERRVKPEMARRFLDTIACQGTLEGLLNAFPYPVLRLESPIEEFYRFYRVG
jgi:hypothetical protein